jgi:hypothetical protein
LYMGLVLRKEGFIILYLEWVPHVYRTWSVERKVAMYLRWGFYLYIHGT